MAGKPLRQVTLEQLEELAKLNEPVEALAREQALTIIEDIKVRKEETTNKTLILPFIRLLHSSCLNFLTHGRVA